MGNLNQEVSELTKGLHHMMHLLQTYISAHHYNPSLNSYQYRSQDGHSHQFIPPGGHWSYSGCAESQTESHGQPSSSSLPSHPCPPRVHSQHGSESLTTHLWDAPSLPTNGSGFLGGSTNLFPEADRENSENRPLSAHPPTISQSQPTLYLQPPGDRKEHSSHLLFNSPVGSPTRNSPNSYPHLCPPPDSHVTASQSPPDDISVLMSTQTSRHFLHNPSIYQLQDSYPSVQPVSVSLPTLTGRHLGSSLDSGSPQTNEPHIPLQDPTAIEHTSLECLLGNRGSMESRDSESISSRRSSIGVQTQSTEQSWCLDLTD